MGYVVSDWLTNKGAGPWPFVGQGEKPCYDEGDRIRCKPPEDSPVWDMPDGNIASLTPGHDPCGYWYKGITVAVASINVNVYNLCEFTATRISGIYCDGVTMTSISHPATNSPSSLAFRYQSGIPVSLIGRDVNTIQERSFTPPFNVLSTSNSFTADDTINSTQGEERVLYADTLNKYFFVSPAGPAVRLSSGFAWEARAHINTVVLGTDGKLYFNTGGSSAYAWDDARRPITGALWHQAWELISDGITSTPATNWNTGSVVGGSAGSGYVRSALYYNGNLYISRYVYPGWSNASSISRVNPSTMQVEATYTPAASLESCGPMVGVGGVLYVICYNVILGAFVRALNATTLTPIAASAYITLNNCSPQDTNITYHSGENVIVVVGSPKKFYKLDPTSLLVKSDITLTQFYDVTSSAYLNPNYLIIGTQGNDIAGILSYIGLVRVSDGAVIVQIPRVGSQSYPLFTTLVHDLNAG